MITGIYKITNPNGKIYIGQSVSIFKRFNTYKSGHKIGQPKLYHSLIKYGKKNHIFEIIEECNIIDLNARERFWQEYYDSINTGLNCVYVEINSDLTYKMLLKRIDKKNKTIKDRENKIMLEKYLKQQRKFVIHIIDSII